MLYTLYITDPTYSSWSSKTEIEADNLDYAIAIFKEHNNSRLEVVEYNPLQDQDLLFSLTSQITNLVQELLDNTAKSRGYDGIVSLCTYANSNISKFKTEGQAGVDWRDQCWAKCYQIMSDVQSGTRSIPTPADVLLELPSIIW